MSIHSLRKAIADAKRLEWLTGAFELSLRSKRAQLHRAIQIPRHHSSDILVEFVTDYIEHTVTLIESIQQRVRRLGLEEAIAPAIQTALAFFRAPPLPSRELVAGNEPKLYQLMEQSYLAQRLLEEVSDLCALWRNNPLSPFENTQASLIIHQLIGEKRANQLDTIASRLAREHLPAIRQSESSKRGLDDEEPTTDLEFSHPTLRLNTNVRLKIGSPEPRPVLKYYSSDQ